MKTSLYFEAPDDLSVGTVRIQSEGQSIADWIATPDNRMFSTEDVKPGIYWAEIEPAGVSPQSVIFEVLEGQANKVILPSFSALTSSGSNISFFDAENQQTGVEVPNSINLDALHRSSYEKSVLFSSSTHEIILDIQKSWPVAISPDKRRISIGLSEEKNGRETFDTFRGKSRMEMFAGRVELEIPEDRDRDPWGSNRIRLSAAIEKVRIERCLLPLYRGGTIILVIAPPFSPADLEISITPADPKLRALLRALDAGTSTEVQAVRNDIVNKDELFGISTDPWASILIGLLSIRFPAVFQPIDPLWARTLVARAGWAFDVYVIQASQILSAAHGKSSEEQNNAVSQAVSLFAKAQVAGSPYYRYTNQLFAELAGGIMSYLKVNEPRIDPIAVRKFERIYARWHRELPLQRGAGPTFTWLARDLDVLKKHKSLVPNRNPSGRLRGYSTSVVFEGEISAGQITFLRGSQSSFQHPSVEENTVQVACQLSGQYQSESLPPLPAFSRPLGSSLDPNKGRFGGQAVHDGFFLTAEFEPTKSREWVTIVLTVQAERSMKIGLGDFAWFSLHPTFFPSIIKVSFRGRRAQLRIQAWGGFTVGIWIPKANVELECDLSQLERAPNIIKSR
ncbi:pYEATS domain-containing protein [Yersinia sp. 1252 StPb PI]|uniref:pYEATS domain-containing protein n=1 Tax=Yersinia sp. 1252 StPb PI TaxID=3117404 RepID=UPI003B28D651